LLLRYIERRTPLLIRKSSFEIWTLRPAILLQLYRGFPLFLKASASMLSEITTRPHLSAWIENNWLLRVLLHNVTWPHISL